jgi:hypothetical protein
VGEGHRGPPPRSGHLTNHDRQNRTSSGPCRRGL